MSFLKQLSNLSKISGQVPRFKSQAKNLLHTSSRLGVADVQKPAPDFEGIAVYEKDFKTIRLSDFKNKYLILFFYPLDFTFVCPTEIIAFSDRVKEFEAVNASVVGVSVDSHFSHLAWINTPRKVGGLGDLNIPLLSDITKNISANYDVLIKEEGVALRGLYIIDPKGMIRQKTVNDLPIGRSVDETLRLLQAIQHFEEHGEVCPANWSRDKNPSTIKPDTTGSKEYFNEQYKS